MTVFASVALLVWCIQRPPALDRLPVVDAEGDLQESRLPVSLVWLAWPLAGLLFFGFGGLLITGISAPLLRAWIGRLESASEQETQAKISADFPIAMHLLAEVVASGRSVDSALKLVAENTRNPLAKELGDIATKLLWSTDQKAVWSGLQGGLFAPMGRAFARSAESGASIVPTIHRLAHDSRSTRTEQKQTEAKKIGVKTALPLGLCFLPAFVLVGIVPMVLGISTEILAF